MRGIYGSLQRSCRIISTRVFAQQALIEENVASSSSWVVLDHVMATQNKPQTRTVPAHPSNHRSFASSSHDIKDKEAFRESAERLGESIMAGHISRHILGSDMTRSIKEWDITVKDGRSPLWRWIEDTLISSWQNMIASFITSRIETSFDLSEWLEASKDAFWAVHMFGSTEEYHLLKPMMSDALYLASERIFENFKSRKMQYAPREPDGDIDARICGIQFIKRDEMLTYVLYINVYRGMIYDGGREKRRMLTFLYMCDCSMMTDKTPQEDSEPPDSEISGTWMVVSVEFKASCTVDILDETTKELVSNIVDASPKIYKFCTGPLPNALPRTYLQSPWKLLSYV